MGRGGLWQISVKLDDHTRTFLMCRHSAMECRTDVTGIGIIVQVHARRVSGQPLDMSSLVETERAGPYIYTKEIHSKIPPQVSVYETDTDHALEDTFDRQLCRNVCMYLTAWRQI